MLSNDKKGFLFGLLIAIILSFSIVGLLQMINNIEETEAQDETSLTATPLGTAKTYYVGNWLFKDTPEQLYFAGIDYRTEPYYIILGHYHSDGYDGGGWNDFVPLKDVIQIRGHVYEVHNYTDFSITMTEIKVE